MHAVFLLVNAVFFTYACTYFIGWREGYADIKAAWQKMSETSQLHSSPVHANNMEETLHHLPVAQHTKNQGQIQDAA